MLDEWVRPIDTDSTRQERRAIRSETRYKKTPRNSGRGVEAYRSDRRLQLHPQHPADLACDRSTEVALEYEQDDLDEPSGHDSKDSWGYIIIALISNSIVELALRRDQSTTHQHIPSTANDPGTNSIPSKDQRSQYNNRSKKHP